MLVLILVGLASAVPGVSAQDPAASGLELDFQDADPRVVISALAEIAGLNVLFTDVPTDRKVTLRSPNRVTPDLALRYLENLVEAYGLEMTREDDVARIGRSPEPDARSEREASSASSSAPAASAVRLYVYPLKHAQAYDLSETLSAAFGLGSAGPLSRDRDRQSLSESLREQDRMPLEGPPEDVVEGEEADVAGLGANLEGPVQIVSDARTNSLVIRATPEDYERIRQAIEQLDTRPLQVLIEVLIAEISRDRQLNLGVDLTVPEQESDEAGLRFEGQLLGTGPSDFAVRLQQLGGLEAEVVIRALAADADVTILSRPLILAQNNQEARILVGSERPFIQLFRALPTDAAVRDQVVQFRDVGTQLHIRPTINPDGYVTLDLLQEVSAATTETQFGAPVISTREAETRLLVRDGHTVILGGLVDEQEEQVRSGIPLLKDIPVLGVLFGSTRKRRINTELFLVITPHVLQSDEDMDSVTRELREAAEHLDEVLPDPLPLVPDLRLEPVKPPAPDTTGSGGR